MTHNRKFHYLVRAVIINDNKLLLAQHNDKDTTFLPGGHIENFESAEDAIIREIDEELKYISEIDFFLGAIENKWNDGIIDHFELNLIFKLNLKDVEISSIPKSYDSRIHFFWIDIKDIDKISLKPIRLKELILNNLKKSNNNFWHSNYN